ncbi:MAG: zf-HC2 domain-containing protein [Planctomycetota bacterium]
MAKQRKQLKAWLDNELDAATARQVEEHVASNREDRETTRDFERLSRALKRGQDDVVLPSQDTLAAIVEQGKRARSGDERLVIQLQRLSALAAVFLLVVTLGLLSASATSDGTLVGDNDAVPPAEGAPATTNEPAEHQGIDGFLSSREALAIATVHEDYR